MAKASLIIVDDEQLNADGIRMLIEHSHLAVTIAGVFYSSTAALEYLDRNRVDIIVTDIQMPQISGLELVRHIKKSNPSAEIIIFTGYGSLAYAKEAMKYGVRYFLEKPVAPEKLSASVKGCLEDYRRHKQEKLLQLKQMIENVLLDEQDLSRVKDVPFTVVSLEENQFERVRTPLEGYFEAAEAIFVRVSHSGQIMYCVYGRLNLETPMIQIEHLNFQVKCNDDNESLIVV
ncbi:response regulator, partial [Lacticaseibacillus camelliae]|uniref:response regulator n=2 Tax=Lacticaseibacillus camelliae TaxID=381742 RepID=UPI000A50AEFA